ncbi:MAG: Druantia anti-phage system protein DruA, partial [candidate division WOR-3 bacterium]
NIRRMNTAAIEEARRKARRLAGLEDKLLSTVAAGYEVDVERIKPRLIPVRSGTLEADIFRYFTLHWSILVSQGYGRRLRFLIQDENNGKYMGILGIGDPVFNLGVRDEWIGWGYETRRRNLCHVMDAFVLGSIPPYNALLVGKFIAMAAVSREIRECFVQRYSGRKTIIKGREIPPELAIVTTTSALGRSSIYNRLKFRDRPVFYSVGFSRGWGTFHLSNGVYSEIFKLVSENTKGTAKSEGWGGGEFRNRWEVVRKGLRLLGFSGNWLQHGVLREVFVGPTARNSREFLLGKADSLEYYPEGIEDYWDFFRERYLLPRAKRRPDYLDFDKEEWRLWKR